MVVAAEATLHDLSATRSLAVLMHSSQLLVAERMGTLPLPFY